MGVHHYPTLTTLQEVVMKRSVLIALVVVFSASMAFAQAGSIGIYADNTASSCDIVAAGFAQIHSFHMNAPGATGSQWKLDHPVAWTHFGDIWEFPTIIGNSSAGVSIGYGACLASPIYLGVSNYGASGDPACTFISVIPDPTSLSGQIEGVDCAANKTFPTGGAAYVNGDGSCPCNVPVEETTWGGVKALYQ
jgi:hypothetical protein